MATNCLITKLNGKVTNDNLPRLNSTIVTLENPNISSDEGDTFVIHHLQTEGVDVYIHSGTAHFTDSTGVENYGYSIENATDYYVKVESAYATLRLENLHLLKSVNSYNSNVNQPYISYNLKELLQGGRKLDRLLCGDPGETTLGKGDSCYGDVTDMTINCKGPVYLSGCDKLTGSLDNIVMNLPKACTRISFCATYLTLKTVSLAGEDGEHSNLKVFPNNHATGDIKYFADTANRCVIAHTAAATDKFTGTVEDLIQRLIDRGRTTGTGTSNEDSNDLFAFEIKKAGTLGFHNVTYNGIPLSSYYSDPLNTGNKSWLYFNWNASSPNNGITYFFGDRVYP